MRLANTQEWTTGGRMSNLLCKYLMSNATTDIDIGYCIDAVEYIPTGQTFWDEFEGNTEVLHREL